MVNTTQALKQYQNIDTAGCIPEANSHRLIQMLMEGVLEKLGRAKALINISDFEGKSEQISWAVSIISGLRDSLNLESGEDIAENLDKLYVYMITRLTKANIENDITIIDEIIQLMFEIKAGWDGISDEVQSISNEKGV